MSAVERRTFWACFLGWALDAMDFQTYAMVMPTLVSLWNMSGSQAGIIGASALLVAPIGGWIAGILADRFGRAKVLRITIVWFATFSFLSGFTNSFGQLLLTRSLQGFGFGGEWVAAMVLIGEATRSETRGRAVGTVQSGWSVGYGIAVAFFAGTFALVPGEYAWRLLFFVGLVPALLVYLVCRNVEEPQIYSDMRASKEMTRRNASPFEIFKPSLLKRTVLAAFLATGALGGNYITLTWLPAYLKMERHLTDLGTSFHLWTLIAGAFVGYFASARLSDAVGRKRTFVINTLGVLATVSAYTFGGVGNNFAFLLEFPLGVFQSGIVAGMGATFTELFPTRVRAGGQGFTYNLGRGIGSAMPALVGYLSMTRGLGTAIGIGAISSYSIVLVATYFLIETRGVALDKQDRMEFEDLTWPGIPGN